MESKSDVRVRAACSAQSMIHSRPKVNALVHLTDGRPYSRTGTNLVALCGANVRPDVIGTSTGWRTCGKCLTIATSVGMTIVVTGEPR